MSDPGIALSVVAPCYQEAAGLEEFYRRVTAVSRQFVRRHEIILVDDGSRDTTWEVIRALAARDPAVRGIRLSRNYGHQFALTAGLQMARGARILMIDADLQDPPELLQEMLASMDAGADVVYGRRIAREGETRFKRWSAWWFYRIIRYLSDTDIPSDTGDFRLVSRRVLDALNSMGEHHRFVRGMVSWLGFEQVAVSYRRDARHAGATGYSFRKMARFALDALTSFSIRPLRLASYLGFGLASLSILMAIYSVGQRLLGNTVQGWTSLMVVVLVIGGLQLFVLGIIGEYLGRLFIEAKGRPLYLVREVVGGAGGSEQLKRVDVHGDHDVVRQRQFSDDRAQMTAEL